MTWFLFHYCTMPHATTELSLAELMFEKQLRTLLDRLKPDIAKTVRAQKEQQKRAHNAHMQQRELQPGAQVYAKNFGQGPPWLPGVIQESKGPVSYTVELEDGRVLCQHVDHLRDCIATAQPSVEMDDYPTFEISSQIPDLPPAAPPSAPVGQGLRRSSRTHKSPDLYGVTVRH